MEAIQADMKIIKKWTDANSLSFNFNKTNVISFKCELAEIYVENEEIKGTSAHKFLGIHIDSKLKFGAHIEYLCGKVSSSCYALRILCRELDERTAKGAYFALVESHLRYGVCFWGSCSQYHFNRLFILQKRAVRLLYKANRRDSCRPLFVAHKILTLPSIFLLEIVCLIHKKYWCSLNVGSSGTRQTHFLTLPIPRTSLIKNSIIYMGKKAFNNLPLNLRAIENLRKFRTHVKKLLIPKGYYNIDEYFGDNFN